MPFRTRSFEKEFLDAKSIPSSDLQRNLQELQVINTLLGGYRVTEKGLKRVIRSGEPVKTVLDIGFGSGDSIFRMARVAWNMREKIFFHGVDYKEECVVFAEKNLSAIPNKRLHYLDYRNIPPAFYSNIDVIHCGLFLHHLDDDSIIRLLRLSLVNNCVVVINDLHRNRFAYYAIKFFTYIFSKSWLVKNDAPLSVKRGFRKKELETLLHDAGFTKFEIRWQWAFRYLVIAWK